MGISGKGCRAKGTRAEVEFVDLMNQGGIPCMRVLGSGAMKGAQSDIKVGLKLDAQEKVELVRDKKFPAKDEARSVMRAECKSRANNPDWLHQAINNNISQVATVSLLSRMCPEYLYDYLNQDAISKIVVLKRNKTPQGAISKGDLNQAYMVCMGMSDFVDLFKLAYPDVIVEGLIAGSEESV